MTTKAVDYQQPPTAKYLRLLQAANQNQIFRQLGKRHQEIMLNLLMEQTNGASKIGQQEVINGWITEVVQTYLASRTVYLASNELPSVRNADALRP